MSEQLMFNIREACNKVKGIRLVGTQILPRNGSPQRVVGIWVDDVLHNLWMEVDTIVTVDEFVDHIEQMRVWNEILKAQDKANEKID